MISLTHISTRELPKEAISPLFDILGLSNTLPSDIEENVEFSDVFYDYLLELTSLAISIDWKWDPNNLFSQIIKALPSHRVRLTSSVANENYNEYTIHFTFDTSPHSVIIQANNPNEVIQYINGQLTEEQFIYIDFGGDSYEWLLVPANFKLDEFAKLTGYAPQGTSIPPSELSATREYLVMLFYDASCDGHILHTDSASIERWKNKIEVKTGNDNLRKILKKLLPTLDPNQKPEILLKRIRELAPRQIDDLILRQD